MLILLLKVLYFCLPAYIANMAPVLIAKPKLFEFMNIPVDLGKTWQGQPIFGKGKTWRGIIMGIVIAICVTAIQKILYEYGVFQSISVVNFYETNFLLFGALAGAGALLGDLFKSFFKRRIGIGSGKSWPVADQLDFIAGFILFTYWLVYPEWEIIFTAALITLILHPLTNIIGYALKIKKVWW
jgi:CDP-2,3-bis-(O-geranylgeranyl)-sn-glycerol synthase